MIEDPPRLQIHKPTRRPSKAQIEALAGTATGFLVDAMFGRGALDYRIKGLAGTPLSAAGVALTCQNGPDDNLGLLGAVHIAQAGDFIVAGTEGFAHAAVTGDLVLGMASNRGVVGFATDGLIRDVDGCRAVGIATFSRGVTPNSPVRNGPGSVGLPVNLGPVHVCSGDIVVSDENGVVIVPFDQIDTVIARLESITEQEAEMDRKVMTEGLDDPPFLAAMIEAGDVKIFDGKNET